MTGDPLPEILEQAAREAITFSLVAGRVRYDGAPTPGLLAALREHREEITRTLERGQCCWCRRRPGHYKDHDTRLPMCRSCALEIGQGRLDVDDQDVRHDDHDHEVDLGAACSHGDCVDMIPSMFSDAEVVE